MKIEQIRLPGPHALKISDKSGVRYEFFATAARARMRAADLGKEVPIQFYSDDIIKFFGK